MAKFLGAASLVALALLDYLVGIQGVELNAQKKPHTYSVYQFNPQGHGNTQSSQNHQTTQTHHSNNPPTQRQTAKVLPPPHQQSRQSNQAPQSQQISQSQKPASPKEPHLYPRKDPKLADPPNCEVRQSSRIQCGQPDVNEAECDRLGCCFRGQQCYYGSTVTVQCTKDGQFILVVPRDDTVPSIDLESISLLEAGEGCTHADSNSEFAVYQFPVTRCGSIVWEENGVIIYENKMTSTYEVGVGARGAITRDSQYELLFQCRYVGTSVETLAVHINPIRNPPLPVAGQGPTKVQLRLGNGQCSTKGCNEVDAAYSSFYTEADYPVTKVLRDPVYVEVQLLEKTDPLLVLTLGRCWANTSPQPHSLPQWDILIDGCPYRDDRYLSSLVSMHRSSDLEFPSHYRRFIFKMFTFVNPTSMVPMSEMVYIHCSTSLCYAAPGARCEPMCLRRKRDVTAVSQKESDLKVVTSSGPVTMVSSQ